MKFKKIISVALCLITVFCFSLTSCSDITDVVEHSGPKGELGFLNPETNITYISCSASVMPVTQGELYCQLDRDNRYRTVKYEDPLRFLCDDTEFTSYVYRASDIPDITMETFFPVAALVFKEGNESIYMGRLNAEPKYLDQSVQDMINNYSEGQSPVSDDSEYVYAIRDAMKGEPVLTIPPTEALIDKDSMLHVRLLSAEYPGLCYLVVYYRGIDGNDYLMDYGSYESFKCPLGVALRLWEFLA